MPKIYSDAERERIRKELVKEAERELFHYGVKKSTVDEITGRCSLAKGSFYLFFHSKEELFLYALKSFREEMEKKLLELLEELDENHIVTSLTEVFHTLAMNIYLRGMFRLFEEKELSLILRKLGEGVVEEEKNKLTDFFTELFSYFAIDDKDAMSSFSSSFFFIVSSMGNLQYVDDSSSVLRTLVRGLIFQLVE